MRDWPETNCYTDLWIEVLNAMGLPPEAMLGFTLRQDFEGDQFTFFKPPLDDLEDFYGLSVGELSIFDDLEAHAEIQVSRGRLVLVEVDAFFLPDTREVSYRSAHSKTTIAINGIDSGAQRLAYFHNAGYFALDGEDYEGLFAMFRNSREGGHLFPYVEFAKLPQYPQAPSRTACAAILARHMQKRPLNNPFRQWGDDLPRQLDDLAARPEAYFHIYAFNTLRQFGANFDLLASHLEWLDSSTYAREIDASRLISRAAKTMQFQLARAVARRKFAGLAEAVDPMANAWDAIMQGLEAKTGARLAA